jgi:hypothetical protein
MPHYMDIESAFEYVGSSFSGGNRAVYDKATDKFYYQSDMLDESDIPEDTDWDQCVEVPHKNDLDLGSELVFEFVRQMLPDEQETVYQIFRRRGAYGRAKDFLERRNLLEKWYAFEESAHRRAIEQWCEENGLEITGQD